MRLFPALAALLMLALADCSVAPTSRNFAPYSCKTSACATAQAQDTADTTDQSSGAN